MHADRTAVTIQTNKIVLNEVKDNQTLLEPSNRKKNNNEWTFWPTQYVCPVKLVGEGLSFFEDQEEGCNLGDD